MTLALSKSGTFIHPFPLDLYCRFFIERRLQTPFPHQSKNRYFLFKDLPEELIFEFFSIMIIQLQPIQEYFYSIYIHIVTHSAEIQSLHIFRLSNNQVLIGQAFKIRFSRRTFTSSFFIFLSLFNRFALILIMSATCSNPRNWIHFYIEIFKANNCRCQTLQFHFRFLRSSIVFLSRLAIFQHCFHLGDMISSLSRLQKTFSLVFNENREYQVRSLRDCTNR